MECIAPKKNFVGMEITKFQSFIQTRCNAFGGGGEKKLENLIQTCVAAGLKGNSFVKVFSAFMIYFDVPDEEFISRRTFGRKINELYKDKIEHSRFVRKGQLTYSWLEFLLT